MKQRNFLKLISLALLTMFTFVSCSKGAREITQAFLKTAEIKSYTFDSSAKIHLEFPGELVGLEDSFPLDLNLTSTGAYNLNKDKLPTKLVNINFDVMDLKFDTEYYIEPSKDKELSLEYYFKMPKFIKPALGLGSKKEEYLKFSLYELLSEISDGPLQRNLYEQVLKNQETVIQMNKQVFDILLSLGSDDSLKDIITDKGYQELKRRNGNMFAETYEINLDNQNYKKLLKSIVSNDEAMKNILELSKNSASQTDEIDVTSILRELTANKEMLLSQIDNLPNIFGEKGLSFTFSIHNGYIVYQKYAFDINVENLINLQAEVETSYYDINRPVKIDRPEIDDNYVDKNSLLSKFNNDTDEMKEELSEIENSYNYFESEIVRLETSGRSIEGEASDYFYPQEKSIYHFTDEYGNVAYSLEFENFTDDKTQVKYSYPNIDYSAVYSMKNNTVKLVYVDEYTELTDLTSEENFLGDPMISGPLKEGNYWINSNNSTTFISSIDIEVSTPSGTYKAIEVINFFDNDNYQKCYYAKGVGLVKTITNYYTENNLVNSTVVLSKIEK
ncbi:hypothetical protein [Oceanirhabdus sp. W0125-5]|uniref:hypothetical protein n=1 Tax=Oceanirhabdus sp. W0125-5 TaxID=2999116 RepID=UPI0022F336CF|nr:hypothetical protein [Oceanirhabdus sp. W0125-5]WBW94729.1 hypothetical protein OW730_13590 [Oceanirhabdus sp. W0125-5]